MNDDRAGSRARDPHWMHGQAATSAALAAPRPLLPSTRRHRAPEGAASRSFAKALTIALLLLLGAAWLVPHAVMLPLFLLCGMWLLFLPALAKPAADRHGPTDRRVLALGGLFGAVAIGALLAVATPRLSAWLPRLCSGLAIVQFAGGLRLALAIDG